MVIKMIRTRSDSKCSQWIFVVEVSSYGIGSSTTTEWSCAFDLIWMVYDQIRCAAGDAYLRYYLSFCLSLSHLEKWLNVIELYESMRDVVESQPMYFRYSSRSLISVKHRRWSNDLQQQQHKQYVLWQQVCSLREFHRLYNAYSILCWAFSAAFH